MWTRTCLLAVLVGCHAQPAAQAPEPAPLGRVLDVVHETHRPLVVFFHAPWCQGCREFIRDVLSDPRVAHELGDTPVVAYDVDTDNGYEAARRCHLATIPSLVAVDREGVMTVLPSAPRSVDALLAFLRKTRVLIAPPQAASPPPP